MTGAHVFINSLPNLRLCAILSFNVPCSHSSEIVHMGTSGNRQLYHAAALATYRIRNLWEHLSRVKKDIANRRSLRRLVHQRAKILRYLKRVDEDRYDRVLERLGLERSAVEGELVV